MEERRLGVIDSLSAGLNLVSQRLWIILIPVLLDLWYWRGPRLSIAPLLNQIKQLIMRSVPQEVPAAPVSIEMAVSMLDIWGERLNLFSLLSTSVLGVPSLMASGVAGQGRIVEVSSWAMLVGLAVPLLLAGLAIGCLYLTLIVQGVRFKPTTPADLLRQAGAMWLRVVALGLLLLLLTFFLVLPFLFMVSLLTFLSGGLASFLLGIFYVGVIWLTLYLFFVIDAIAINEVGPVRAIWNSVNVVARNFWSALGLIVLIYVLGLGLSLIWIRLAEAHPMGTLLAIAAHAFIGSGLAAAGLIFYRDRYLRWQNQT